ncbi:hypothetical protein QTP88_028293 [Uroleucon formosanum]
MVEGSFTSAGITADSTKFEYVIGALPPKYAVHIKDIIMTPPSNSKYVKIKQDLIKRLSASQEEKTRQLLERVEIVDLKSSQFLHHLQSLADSSVPETLLRTLWMGRLPKSIQVALAIVKDNKLEYLAVHADNIADASGPLLPQIAETSRSDTIEAMFNLKISQLTLRIHQGIATLRSEVAAINTRPSHGLTQLTTQGHTAKCSIPYIKVVVGETEYDGLLRKFPEITRPYGVPKDIKHSTKHYIQTTPGPPVSYKPRRLAPVKFKAAKREFEAMIQLGIIRPSQGPWSSPLHLVSKNTTDAWRLCWDNRALNARSIPDRYPVCHSGLCTLSPR